ETSKSPAPSRRERKQKRHKKQGIISLRIPQLKMVVAQAPIIQQPPPLILILSPVSIFFLLFFSRPYEQSQQTLYRNTNKQWPI
uniref:Uncharacterized protein n=1 Tax=Oryza brachyantha TaxID=4533 RepID=J3LWH6_ORYBR